MYGYGIQTENAILTTCLSNAEEMYVNLDAENTHFCRIKDGGGVRFILDIDKIF